MERRGLIPGITPQLELGSRKMYSGERKTQIIATKSKRGGCGGFGKMKFCQNRWLIE
jgi:hypothetical protein